MRLPQRLAEFNRYVTNPVQRLWAGWLPSFGILEHVGRKSGKPYRTPLTVFSTRYPPTQLRPPEDGVAVLLSYGPDRDWLKNVEAAGEARLQRRGTTFTVGDPRVVSKAEAAPHVTGIGRFFFPRLPFDSAVLLDRRP